jgi:hypothetical protein
VVIGTVGSQIGTYHGVNILVNPAMSEDEYAVVSQQMREDIAKLVDDSFEQVLRGYDFRNMRRG